MSAATLIVGIALLALGLLGPQLGSRGLYADGGPRPGRDHRQARVLILRLLATFAGAVLLILSLVHLLHGHGRLGPSDVQDKPAETRESR